MDMTGPNSRRFAAGRIASQLMLLPEFREEWLEVRNSAGEIALVPALETDTLEFVTALVRRAGGSANVFAIGASDEDQTARLAVFGMTTKSVGEGVEHPLPVSSKTTVGDLVRMLTPGTSVTFRLAEDELAVNDIIEGPLPEGLVVV